ncbi:MAG: hydroxylase [Actinobacteria bacterium]|nr:hydroxylase [Actinomycetota bacterium]MBI3687793.1 hydroxylase [Actinomycetota bacterium]
MIASFRNQRGHPRSGSLPRPGPEVRPDTTGPTSTLARSQLRASAHKTCVWRVCATRSRVYASRVEEPVFVPDTPEDPLDDNAAAVSPEAVIDLLGALAYGELVAFDRLAADARLAPTLAGRAALAGMAAAEMGHYERLVGRIRELGSDPERAMEPFIVPVDAFHEQTKPSIWLEGLVKAYVGDGFAADFYREIATLLDPVTQKLVLDSLADTGQADFAIREVRAAIAADPVLAGRLALWARRLVGEALSQAQRVTAERDSLTELIIGGSGDLSGVLAMFKRITRAHGDRMTALGLSS